MTENLRFQCILDRNGNYGLVRQKRITEKNCIYINFVKSSCMFSEVVTIRYSQLFNLFDSCSNNTARGEKSVQGQK